MLTAVLTTCSHVVKATVTVAQACGVTLAWLGRVHPGSTPPHTALSCEVKDHSGVCEIMVYIV